MLALGSMEVNIFILPPQPLPVTLQLHAPDRPFRAGFSAICLNKPLSRECKRHCEHKPPVTSALLSDMGAVGGRLGSLVSGKIQMEIVHRRIYPRTQEILTETSITVIGFNVGGNVIKNLLQNHPPRITIMTVDKPIQACSLTREDHHNWQQRRKSAPWTVLSSLHTRTSTPVLSTWKASLFLTRAFGRTLPKPKFHTSPDLFQLHTLRR
nr:uncharacterized protein LOC110360618 [Columba livia]